jgi:ribonuclease VapC
LTIFVDASALIAIVTGEPAASTLSDILEADRNRLCSAISVWETIAGLCRSYMFSVPSARAEVQAFLEIGGFRFVSIGEQELEIAADDYAQFGKGCHPAKLNMGDCYAYACAKTNAARLLFIGDDFNKTDIQIAS